jgi:zinc/manganese transport system substrate-binding protein
MNCTIRYGALLAVALVVPSAWADLDIFACEPEWAALAHELGGSTVTIFSATSALQDPHQIQARPSLIAKARRADLAVCTGAELEIGWMPMIQRQAGNPRIQSGQPSYFEAADYVQLLEVPTQLDRSEGDVHALGNPHIQTDPRNIALIAKALSARMAQLDPRNAQTYTTRYQDFAARWQAAIGKWQQDAAPLEGTPIVVHHKSWVYLENWLGLQEVAALEPKPGVPPSGAHLAQVLMRLETQPAKMIIRAGYQDSKPSEWLSERARIPAVILPGTVNGTPEAKDLFTLFDDSVRRLLQAVQQ